MLDTKIIRNQAGRDGCHSLCGVAIRITRYGTTHIGVLHRGDDTVPPLLLHVGWHFQFDNDSSANEYLWIELDIPIDRQKSIAAMCRKVWRNYQETGFPYGLKHCTTFDFTGTVRSNPSYLGFTCATFVLAIFESCYVKLIDKDSWQGRPEDAEWQKQILALLAATGAEKAHVEAVQGQIGTERFRPEEVAAAGALFPPTAATERAIACGVQILALLRGTAAAPAGPAGGTTAAPPA